MCAPSSTWTSKVAMFATNLRKLSSSEAAYCSALSTALKQAIEAEQEGRQKKFDEKLHKAYDAIKLVVDAALESQMQEIESQMSLD